VEFEISNCLVKIRNHQPILILALLVSLFNWKRNYEKILLSSFLFVCVLIEIVINKYLLCTYSNNTASNNFYIIIIIWFYLTFFKDVAKKFIKISIEKIAIIFVIISIVYGLMTNLNLLHTMPYLIGLILTTILICLYLFNLVNSTDNLLQIIQEPRFWLGCGIILFTSINFPILVHSEEIRYNSNLAIPFFKVINFSNIALSLSYLLCTICHQKTKLYSTR